MRYLTTLAAFFVFTGCGFFAPPAPGWGEDDIVVDDWVSPPPDYGTVDGRIENPWVQGQMNDVGTFAGDAYEVQYSGYEGYSSIRLDAGRRGGDDFGWVMISLSTSVEGGFEGDQFEPGDSVNTEVYATGCTGPDHGNYVFDGGAENVSIVVEAGPTETSRLFHYRADFSGQGYTEGSFVLTM